MSSFYFEYTKPSLDWYEIARETVEPDDYDYFELQLRYGRMWWLVGHKIDGEWNDTGKTIGSLSKRDAAKFVDWARHTPYGNKLLEISAISASLDLVEEMSELIEIAKNARAETAKKCRHECKEGSHLGRRHKEG